MLYNELHVELYSLRLLSIHCNSLCMIMSLVYTASPLVPYKMYITVCTLLTYCEHICIGGLCCAKGQIIHVYRLWCISNFFRSCYTL